jgi:hypothetical protein
MNGDDLEGDGRRRRRCARGSCCSTSAVQSDAAQRKALNAVASQGAQALHSIGRQLQLLLLWRCSIIESSISCSRR